MNQGSNLSQAPVVEVVFGVQFEDIVFKNQHIYDFYQKIKERFPEINEQPPLPTIIEKIDTPNEQSILPGYNVRRFFINSIQNKLIQIQPNKLLFNWRKSSISEEYPHFSVVYKEFKNVYSNLNSNNLDEKINQVEVTYVDHIIMDDFQKTDYNPDGILNITNFPNKKIKSIESNLHFPVDELDGNLILKIRSGIRNVDQKKLLVIETTCRGSLNGTPFDQWFEIAHRNLVNFFNETSSNVAKTKWGIKI